MKLLELALGGAGLYVLYRSGILQQVLGSAGIPLPTGAPSNPASPSPANPAAPTPSVDTRALVLSTVQQKIASGEIAPAAYGGSATYPLMSASLWNWYYMKVRGRDPSNVPGVAPGNVSIDEWWPVVSAAGFNGLRGLVPSAARASRYVQNGISPEPRNVCARVPGMGRQFSGGF